MEEFLRPRIPTFDGASIGNVRPLLRNGCTSPSTAGVSRRPYVVSLNCLAFRLACAKGRRNCCITVTVGRRAQWYDGQTSLDGQTSFDGSVAEPNGVTKDSGTVVRRDSSATPGVARASGWADGCERSREPRRCADRTVGRRYPVPRRVAVWGLPSVPSRRRRESTF